MQLHQLKPRHQSKSKKRVGRGGKKGTYSGKGVKGQKSRAGRKFQPMIRESIKRYPKLRGYRQNPKGRLITTVNLTLLEKKFETGDKVSPQVLLNKRIISKIKGKKPAVKILAVGDLKKKLIIEDCLMSESAKQKIEKAGGEIIINKSLPTAEPCFR